ncbi:MAG: 50S ribosomal protein L25/general stress protein Ctc [Rhodospirillaceae bacterium]|nr:50S ribosomal protein L25/general stress protein Ctc [Rhodospirillaceae bacterium]
MPKTSTLQVQGRDRAGKGAARATRRGGLVPGVIYGGNQDATLIALEPRVLVSLMHDPAFKINIFEVEIDGKKQRTMAMDVQVHPVSDQPIHADFRRIEKDTLVRVPIPVRFHNEAASPGIKVGGVLNIVRHEIEVRGRPDDLPDHIDVDLTGLEIGDTVHINAVTLPKGIKVTIARNFTICSVAPPTVMAVEEETPAADEATAEGAVAAEGDAATGAPAAGAPGAAATGAKGAAGAGAKPAAGAPKAAAAPAKAGGDKKK